jgi:hypothetical protein
MCWGGMIDSVLLEYDSDPKWRLHPVRATTNALRLRLSPAHLYAPAR